MMAEDHNTRNRFEAAWAKLSGRWEGELKEKFHKNYVVSFSEMAESFDTASKELDEIAAELLGKLEEIEKDIRK